MRCFAIIFATFICFLSAPLVKPENPRSLDRAEAEKVFDEYGVSLSAWVDRVSVGNDADLLDFLRLVCKIEADFHGGWSHAAQGVYDTFATVADKAGDTRLALTVNALNLEEKDAIWSVLLGGVGGARKLREELPNTLTILEGAFLPIGITNPKQLVPPIWLTRAPYCMCDGETGGTLTDSKGQDFHYYSRQQLYTGFISGHLNDRMKARFDGWTEDDLWQLVEDTIKKQFVWDESFRRFQVRDRNDLHSKFLDEPFGQQGLKQLSRRAKGMLKRSDLDASTQMTDSQHSVF